MKRFCLIVGWLWLPCMLAVAQPTVLPPPQQIAGALHASPETMRDGATIYGYDAARQRITLREGTNDMICTADDPAADGFSVACYHKSLEPFMARGRALRAAGKGFQEVFDTREREVQAGTLRMPLRPTTLYVYSAEKYDTQTGTAVNGSLRFVVYVPYATAETTGLSAQPMGPGEPWLMDAGTHRAHIMITPPRQ